MASCLIVDDNEINLLIARKMVEKLGFVVSTASSAEAALPQLRAALPDAVLLDWHMPGMTGLELLQKIRATEQGLNTAIFIYSGMENETGIRAAFEAGADGFIPKPVSEDKIIREFRKLRLL